MFDHLRQAWRERIEQGSSQGSLESGTLGGVTATKDTWHFDPQDNDEQRRILRSNKSAQTTRRRFPSGTRVVPREASDATNVGTVKRHVPGVNAQGGYLLVEWDNGATGRHGPIALKPYEGE